MKLKELTKICMMIQIENLSLVYMVYAQIFQRYKG